MDRISTIYLTNGMHWPAWRLLGTRCHSKCGRSATLSFYNLLFHHFLQLQRERCQNFKSFVFVFIFASPVRGNCITIVDYQRSNSNFGDRGCGDEAASVLTVILMFAGSNPNKNGFVRAKIYFVRLPLKGK